MTNLTNIHAGLTIAAGAVFISVCSISVALRFYARKLKGVGFGIDDWLIVVALIFTVAMDITLIAEVGIGQLGYAAPSAAQSAGKPDSNIAFWPDELLQIPALGALWD